MADNTTLNLGSGGDTIATDDIAGVKHQRVKVQYGVDGAATDVSDTNPLPIDDAGGSITVDTAGGALDVSGATVNVASASALDCSGATVTVDLGTNNDVTIEGGAVLGTTGNAGPANAISVGGTESGGTFREFAVDASGNIQADIVGALPTGANTIGEVTIGAATGAAGDLAKVVDAAAGGTDVGVAALAVRDDALTTLTPVDGDYTPLRVNSTGALHVTGSAGVTEYTLGTATYTEASSIGNIAAAVRNDTLAALANTDNEIAPLQVNSDGALYVEVSSVANAQIDDAAFSTTTDSVSMIGAVATPTDTAVDADDGGAVGMTTNRALYVSIQDDSVGIGGGTQYTEDAAAAADPVGNATILVRDDTPGAITSTDGDNIAQRGTNFGAAFCQIVDSSGNFVDSFGGSGGTSAADDADFTAGTTQGTPAMGVYESTPTSVTDGDLGTVGITQTRSLKVEETNSTAILADTANMDTNLGTIAGAVSGTEMQVDIVSGNVTNAGTFAVQEDGAALTALQLIDDAVHADDAAFTLGTSKGVMMMGFAGTQTVDANDAAALACDTDGALHIADGGNSITIDNADITTVAGAVSGTEMQVDVVAALPAGDNNIGNVDIASSVALDVSAATVTVDLGANNDVQGDVAHDGADSGNPLKIGAKAVAIDGTAPGTDVAENDRTDLKASLDGRLLVEQTHPNFWHTSADYATAQTNATVKAAPGVGLKLYITDVIVSNGATAGNITLLDGSGGTVLLELYPAINGGLTHSFRSPIALTANTLLAITSTTVTTHSVTISGYIAA